MHFPVSGVECPFWLPAVVAFLVALLTTPAGISGAFLLMPFQMSVLGFVSPAVAPTNLIYNVVSVPGGVGRYIREHRMVWPLAWAIAAGTLPGVLLGAIVRIRYLPDPRYAKAFVGCVLLYLGVRLVLRLSESPGVRPAHAPTGTFGFERQLSQGDNPPSKLYHAPTGTFAFECQGEKYSFSPTTLAAVSLAVGVVGGIYGIGGGAMIAPFLMTVLALPARVAAGAALFGTLVTSVAGVAIFETLGRMQLSSGVAVRPDWALGILFGVGGLAGSYCGARLQKHLPERWIRLFLGCLTIGLGVNYGAQFFRGK
jgi:uncharacterized membrane protein YfcA